MTSLPPDYLERVYAGVLGKIIGVYLGRPFEGWTYERISAELGEIWYYVHDRLNKPLIVTDDDISGTFTFIRALEDCPQAGSDPASPPQTAVRSPSTGASSPNRSAPRSSSTVGAWFALATPKKPPPWQPARLKSATTARQSLPPR